MGGGGLRECGSQIGFHLLSNEKGVYPVVAFKINICVLLVSPMFLERLKINCQSLLHPQMKVLLWALPTAQTYFSNRQWDSVWMPLNDPEHIRTKNEQ